MARNEHMIAALKRERAGYVAHGLDARVDQVDEQLRHYGYDDEADGPQGRQGPEAAQQTADAGAAKKTMAAKKTASPPQK